MRRESHAQFYERPVASAGLLNHGPVTGRGRAEPLADAVRIHRLVSLESVVTGSYRAAKRIECPLRYARRRIPGPPQTATK